MKNSTKKLFVIIIFLSGNSSFCQKINFSSIKNNLKKAIKSYTEISYEAKKHLNKIEKGERANKYYYNTFSDGVDADSYVKLDKKGNYIEVILYNSDLSIDKKNIYKYNKKGSKIIIMSYNSDNSLSSMTIIKNNKKRNYKERMVYSSSKELIYRLFFKFNKKGLPIEKMSLMLLLMIQITT